MKIIKDKLYLDYKEIILFSDVAKSDYIINRKTEKKDRIYLKDKVIKQHIELSKLECLLYPMHFYAIETIMKKDLLDDEKLSLINETKLCTNRELLNYICG